MIYLRLKRLTDANIIEELRPFCYSIVEQKEHYIKDQKVLEDKVYQLKLLTDVPKFIGEDMKEYGAFKKGDITILPFKLAKIFISKGIAEELSQDKKEVL
jgi:hypothetical protein